ncbi:biotin--[acetyl-CoA-carboxylase] ligase [Tautonia rosea]|uniref:biotin--[acetyl-CoA-carboxylase] ligase n=1 Tax=Tautonia rosea TaxID=2728037 RepID=UPI001475DED1|nr:biotin--[acetyl-CoA-carboxylase] ligase [Tautonia rosea]
MPAGWSVVRLGEVGSTNDLAKQHALNPIDPLTFPLVFRADRQTQGRGRGANSWWSDSGSLTFSVLLDPLAFGLEDRHTPLSSLATAIAVIETVEPWIDRGSVALRWPNDVEIDARKIAGILPERINGPLGPRLIIGIGLNVRSNLDEAPDEVRRLAAALAEFSDRPIPPESQETLFEHLLDRLDANLRLLAQDDPGLARSWALRDQLREAPVRIDLGGEIVEGLGGGIGPDGGLRIQCSPEDRVVYGGRVLRA